MRPLHFLFVPALLWSVAPAGAQAIPRPTPPMRYPLKIDRAGLDSSSLRQFELYTTDSLRFDGVVGAADSQRLMVIDPRTRERRYGPLAKIEPEVGSYLLEEEQLAEGRVIARIWSESRYEKLGLEPGWTWWWVDRRGKFGDTPWRSVYIAPSGRTSVQPMYLRSHGPGYRWKQAIARFLWSDSDEATWGTCGGKCCAGKT
jgi:hypothetical protein